MLLRQSLLHGLSSDRGEIGAVHDLLPFLRLKAHKDKRVLIFTEQYGGDLRGPLPGAVALGQGGEGDAAFAAVAALASLVKLVEGVAGERGALRNHLAFSCNAEHPAAGVGTDDPDSVVLIAGFIVKALSLDAVQLHFGHGGGKDQGHVHCRFRFLHTLKGLLRRKNGGIAVRGIGTLPQVILHESLRLLFGHRLIGAHGDIPGSRREG